MQHTPTVDLSLDELEDDPYPAYARLRRDAPVAWIPEAEVWFATRFEECGIVGRGELGFVGATSHPTLQRVFGSPNVLTAGGEEHEDLRTGIDPRLQPGPVHQIIDTLVRQIARRYLEPLDDRTAADLMADYLEPVSVEALRAVMGLDDLVDAETLRRWFADLNLGVSNFGQDPEHFAVADRATAEIEDVIRPRLEHLARHPDDSMLSHMLWTGRDGGKPRSVELILPSLKVILLGGMQEPGHAAGSTLLGLLSRPDQLALAYEDPETYVPMAVHEGLRWIAPIGAVERQASRDVELGGCLIRAGEIVMTILGSANRDESRFDVPDTFDLDRVNRTHQAFGNGSHFCAGHFFARQVQRIMLEELLMSMPGLEPDPGSEPVITGWVFRAPKKLPVRWTRAAARPVVTLRRPVVEPASDHPTGLLRVESMRHEAEDILSLELVDPDGVSLDTWEPGAHVDLWVVDSHAAHYSLCGAPDSPSWRLAVLREQHSRGASAYVHDQLRPGSFVHVGQPRNTFPLPEATDYYFLAGGIGVTPIIPLARAAAASGARVRVTYCGRTRAGMALVDEVRALPAAVRIHVDDEMGLLDLAELAASAEADGATLVACGPEGLIAALESIAERGTLDLHVERFAAGEAHRADDHAFDVLLERSGVRLRVEADQTILGTVQRHGLDVPNVCQEGNCGSCETRVLAGEVDHRDVLLTPRQRRANSRMMICVSRTAGSDLTLDL